MSAGFNLTHIQAVEVEQKHCVHIIIVSVTVVYHIQFDTV